MRIVAVHILVAASEGKRAVLGSLLFPYLLDTFGKQAGGTIRACRDMLSTRTMSPRSSQDETKAIWAGEIKVEKSTSENECR